MQTTKKPGLADLKRLRQEAEANPGHSRPLAKRRARVSAEGRPSELRGGTAQPSPSQDPVDPTPTVAPEDRDLFRKAVANVQRLAPPTRTVLPPAPVAPPSVLKQKRQAASGEEATATLHVSDSFAPALMAKDGTHFLQSGCGPDLLKKLRLGKWPVEATLDLHGATLEQARTRLDGFLSSCLLHEVRCVRVVHGKGYGSKDNSPVLKETVRRWLCQLADILAFVECTERDGGAGAVMVLLRATTSQPPRYLA